MTLQEFLDASRGTERSPIEQELIDGVCFWNQIGPDWFRLVDRATQDVVGSVKRETWWREHTCEARSRGEKKDFYTWVAARRWIEERVAARSGVAHV